MEFIPALCLNKLLNIMSIDKILSRNANTL